MRRFLRFIVFSLMILTLLGTSASGEGTVVGPERELHLGEERVWDIACPGNTGEIAFITDTNTIMALDPAHPEHDYRNWTVTDSRVTALSSLPGSSVLVWGDSEGKVGMVDTQAGKSIHSKVHHAGITSLCPSPDGRFIAAGSGDSTVSVLFSSNLTIRRLLTGSDKMVTDVRFSRDDSLLAIGGLGRGVILYNTTDWSMTHTIPIPHGTWISALEFISIREEEHLVLGDSTGKLIFYSIPSMEAVHSLNLTSWANDLIYLPDACVLVSGGQDGNITLIALHRENITILQHLPVDGAVYSLSSLHSGSSFVSGGANGTLSIWREITDGEGKEGKKGSSAGISLLKNTESLFPVVLMGTIILTLTCAAGVAMSRTGGIAIIHHDVPRIEKVEGSRNKEIRKTDASSELLPAPTVEGVRTANEAELSGDEHAEQNSGVTRIINIFIKDSIFNRSHLDLSELDGRNKE